MPIQTPTRSSPGVVVVAAEVGVVVDTMDETILHKKCGAFFYTLTVSFGLLQIMSTDTLFELILIINFSKLLP